MPTSLGHRRRRGLVHRFAAVAVAVAVVAWGRDTFAQAAVRPVLNWPVNVQVDAHTTTTSIQRGPTTADTSQSTERRGFVVRAHPEGLIISLDADPALVPLTTGFQASAGFMSAVVARDIVVSRTGRFLRLDDTTGLARRTRERWSTMLPAEVIASQQFEAQMKQMVSMERTSGRSRMDWDELIGNLLDREWVEGRPVSDTIETPADPATGIQLTHLRTVTFRGTTPCPAGSGAQTCWQFDTHSHTDTAALRRSIRSNAERLNATAKEIEALPMLYDASFNSHILDAATGRVLRREEASGLVTPSDYAGGDRIFTSRHVTVYTWRPM